MIIKADTTKKGQQFKEVLYYGIRFLVPIWTKWISTDANGNIYAYGIEPVKDRVDAEWKINNTLTGANWTLLLECELEGEDWMQTLRAVA